MKCASRYTDTFKVFFESTAKYKSRLKGEKGFYVFVLCIIGFILSVVCLKKIYYLSSIYKMKAMHLLILSNGHEAVQRSKAFMSTGDRNSPDFVVELWNCWHSVKSLFGFALSRKCSCCSSSVLWLHSEGYVET